MMTRYGVTMILVLCTSLITSQLGYCDTLILKDGRRINGGQAWVEGDQVKINKFGGVVGFKKNEVAEIKRTEPSEADVPSTANRQPYQAPTRSPVAVQARVGNPVARISRSKVIVDVKAKLAGKYSGSYHLQKTLLDGHMEAYEYLKRLPATDVNVQILGNLLKKYYPSFHLIKTLYEGSIKAYRQLNR